jgi:hypothetical protein
MDILAGYGSGSDDESDVAEAHATVADKEQQPKQQLQAPAAQQQQQQQQQQQAKAQPSTKLPSPDVLLGDTAAGPTATGYGFWSVMCFATLQVSAACASGRLLLLLGLISSLEAPNVEHGLICSHKLSDAPGGTCHCRVSLLLNLTMLFVDLCACLQQPCCQALFWCSDWPLTTQGHQSVEGQQGSCSSTARGSSSDIWRQHAGSTAAARQVR